MTHQTPSKQPTKEGAESNSPKQAQSVNTRAQKIARLKRKEYRDAFVASQISVGLPFQIRALREQRGWKQSRLAAEADMLQPRISAMERPGESKFNLETLRRIASAFDVALEVRFVPFSDLVDWSDQFNPESFRVSSFKEDAGLAEKQQPEGIEAHYIEDRKSARMQAGNRSSKANKNWDGEPAPEYPSWTDGNNLQLKAAQPSRDIGMASSEDDSDLRKAS